MFSKRCVNVFLRLPPCSPRGVGRLHPGPWNQGRARAERPGAGPGAGAGGLGTGAGAWGLGPGAGGPGPGARGPGPGPGTKDKAVTVHKRARILAEQRAEQVARRQDDAQTLAASWPAALRAAWRSRTSMEQLTSVPPCQAHWSHVLIACGGYGGCIHCGAISSTESRSRRILEPCTHSCNEGSRKHINKLMRGELPFRRSWWPDGSEAPVPRRWEVPRPSPPVTAANTVAVLGSDSEEEAAEDIIGHDVMAFMAQLAAANRRSSGEREPKRACIGEASSSSSAAARCSPGLVGTEFLGLRSFLCKAWPSFLDRCRRCLCGLDFRMV